MGISISVFVQHHNPTPLQFNYIVFSDAVCISISIFSSLSLSLRQLYSPCQRPHIINLCHLWLMFILCKRAPRDEPIKNWIYSSMKAEKRVITKFQCCFLCICSPIHMQWKHMLMLHMLARLRLYISMHSIQSILYHPAWEMANPLNQPQHWAGCSKKRSFCIQWPWLTPFK